jgi:hypothetical protein
LGTGLATPEAADAHDIAPVEGPVQNAAMAQVSRPPGATFRGKIEVGATWNTMSLVTFGIDAPAGFGTA